MPLLLRFGTSFVVRRFARAGSSFVLFCVCGDIDGGLVVCKLIARAHALIAKHAKLINSCLGPQGHEWHGCKQYFARSVPRHAAFALRYFVVIWPHCFLMLSSLVSSTSSCLLRVLTNSGKIGLVVGCIRVIQVCLFACNTVSRRRSWKEELEHCIETVVWKLVFSRICCWLVPNLRVDLTPDLQ